MELGSLDGPSASQDGASGEPKDGRGPTRLPASFQRNPQHTHSTDSHTPSMWYPSDMKQFFSTLPKSVLAFLALTGGILFIVIGDPPKTVCDAQMDLFKKDQQTFLYEDPKSKAEKKTTKFERLFEHCKATNAPGGCFELFQLTKRMLDGLNSVPASCRGEVAGSAEVKKALSLMTELMIRLAWGSDSPGTFAQKFGWLDIADISLYCRLKAAYSDFLGVPAWEGLREKLLKGLPKADQYPRSHVWDHSLLSENCSSYP